MSEMKELLERVHAAGPFRHWRRPIEETSAGTTDLRNLMHSAESVFEYSKRLVRGVSEDDHRAATVAAFAIMQNLFPLVEALNPDAGKYLAQAAEALRS